MRQVITDDTKCICIVMAPDQVSSQRLIDFLEHPPAEQKYAALKRRLLDSFDLSDNERATRLLLLPPLRDRKLTAFADKMLSLIGDHRPSFFFNYLFFPSLPDDIRIVSSGQQPRQLARLADTLWITRAEHFVVYRLDKNDRQKAKIDEKKLGQKIVCAFITDVLGKKLATTFSLFHSWETQLPVIVSWR